MEQFLKDYLFTNHPSISDNKSYYNFSYSENINEDALTDAWLEKRTSYIYKVGVFCAIDSNKCDFVHVVIGSQRCDISNPEFKGYFYFSEGENDDMGATIERALETLKNMHPAFD